MFVIFVSIIIDGSCVQLVIFISILHLRSRNTITPTYRSVSWSVCVFVYVIDGACDN